MTSTGAAGPTSDEQTAQAGELLDRGRTAQARDVLKDALKASPDHAGLLYQAARADAIDGDSLGAIAALRSLLASHPGYAPARLLLLPLLTEHDLPAAEALALELIADYPRSAWLYAAYARVMLRAMEIGKGRELAIEALRIDPDEQEALRVMALCDIVDGKRGQDEQALRRLIAEHPDDERTLAMMTTALVHRGRTAEALRCAQLLLRMNPTEPVWLTLVRELRYQRHWTLIPMRPLQRWGWGGSIAIWLGGIVAVRALAPSSPGLANALGWTIFTWAVYSWVWPPLLRRLLVPRDKGSR